MNTVPKILISAYAFSPKHGSEQGMGWNWVNQISEQLETWVLTDEYYAAQCREYMAANCIEKTKLHIVGITRPGGRHRIYGYFWLHYITQNLWQRKAFKIAKRLHEQEHFDLIHQLNMIGYREPGYLWKLDVSRPYVWGPIGGHVQMPKSFLQFLGLKNKFIYGIRNILNAWQMRYSPRVRNAMLRADVLFAATRIDVDAIRRIHGRDAILLNETGTTVQMDRELKNKYKDETRSFELIWSGVFLGRKALPLGLHALALVRKLKPELKVRLTILGDGPSSSAWKNLALKLKVNDICIWAGWLSHEKAKERMKKADAMLFTSLQEGTPHVVAEAISLGIPIICHDACGFGDMVTNQCGIKIPMTDPETSILGFSNAILELALDRKRLANLAEGALVRARELTWENKVKILLVEYKRLLNDKYRI